MSLSTISRYPEFSRMQVRGGMLRTDVPAWLALLGGRPTIADPPLHVLFCTWLA